MIRLTIQIQEVLKAINDAVFERLINHLLYLKGYRLIGTPGQVVAKEKTRRGAPDAVFIDGDKYILVESTTQARLGSAKSFFEKLQNDIHHCFDERKTKIPVDEIKKVVLACNSEVKPAEDRKLKQLAKKYNKNVELEILDITNLPLMLDHHSTLLRTYLGINKIKGNIYNLLDFLNKSDRGYQPSLTNIFVARQQELDDCLSLLKTVDVLALFGSAGVGKSKLAVELLERMWKEGYYPLIFQPSIIPAHEDFNAIFQGTGDFIVLLDDVNRSIGDLSALLSFMQRPGINTIKVIVTARDYAVEKVNECLEQADVHWKSIILSKLTDEDIEKIITDDQPWLKRSYTYRKRIVALAKGNARLAMMATQSVEPGGPKNFLENPVLLYEKYFSKISMDLPWIKKTLAIKAIAISWFFQPLEKSNEEVHQILEVEFEINEEALWQMFEQLHQSEIVDLFENDIVKPVDQALGTYAFYRCFLEEGKGLIHLGKWMAAFFSKYHWKVREALIDANNTFGNDIIKNGSTEHLDYLRKTLSTEADIYEYYVSFWFYKRNETLSFVQDWIESREADPGEEALSFEVEPNSHHQPGKYLELLINFWGHANESLKPSVELAIELIEKERSRLPNFLHAIGERFSFRAEEAEVADYRRQHVLLDVLNEEGCSNVQSQIAISAVLKTTAKLLQWHFTDYTGSKRNTFSMVNFDMVVTPEILELRKRLLEIAIRHFEFNKLLIWDVLQVIVNPRGDIDQEVYSAEVPLYNQLIKHLSELQFRHCKWVQKLKERLKHKNVSGLRDTRRFVESEIVTIDLLLNGKPFDRKKGFERQRNDEIEAMKDAVGGKSWKEIKAFILRVHELISLQTDPSDWSLDRGMSNFYTVLGEANKECYKKAMELYFSSNLNFKLERLLTQYSIQKRGMCPRKLLDVISCSNRSDREEWVMALASAVSEKQIFTELLEAVMSIVESSSAEYLVFKIEAYQKFQAAFRLYQKAHPRLKKLKGHNVITYLSQLIYSRRNETVADLGYDFCLNNIGHFTKHMDLLKEIYLYQKQAIKHYDYDGKELRAILEVDRTFLIVSLKRGTIGFTYTAPIQLRDISFDAIWEMENYQELIEDVIAEIATKRDESYIEASDIKNIFVSDNSLLEQTQTKVEASIVKLIEIYYSNKKMTKLLLSLVFQYFRNQFIRCLRIFLLLNKNPEFIVDVHYDRSASTVGSWVPFLQRRIALYEQIIEMINNLPRPSSYSKHKEFFEKQIEEKKIRISKERRNDFKDPV
ncbi:MAG TPA: hypothetical protein PKA53_00285 [Sphingobacterium sp.]|nr:hypothetical protein [Sphingobacterium sp.]